MNRKAALWATGTLLGVSASITALCVMMSWLVYNYPRETWNGMLALVLVIMTAGVWDTLYQEFKRRDRR